MTFLEEVQRRRTFAKALSYYITFTSFISLKLYMILVVMTTKL